MRALTRALELLEATVRDRGNSSVLQLADQMGLPNATAHRLIKVLAEAGFLTNAGRGKHVGGPALHALAALLDPHEALKATARPILRTLSRATGLTAHMGILQGSMVTYLVKESGNPDRLFTREGTQLEAYCSAIGKVLLAQLPSEEREAYLDTGPFVALTAKTITQPDMLRTHLTGVRQSGFALDDREIAADLICVAVPVFSPAGTVLAAISLAGDAESGVSPSRADLLPLLKRASGRLGKRLPAG